MIKRMEIFVHLPCNGFHPITEHNPGFECGIGLGQHFSFIQPHRCEKEPDAMDRGLANANNPNIFTFDDPNLIVRLTGIKEFIQIDCRHPTSGTATDDGELF